MIASNAKMKHTSAYGCHAIFRLSLIVVAIVQCAYYVRYSLEHHFNGTQPRLVMVSESESEIATIGTVLQPPGPIGPHPTTSAVVKAQPATSSSTLPRISAHAKSSCQHASSDRGGIFLENIVVNNAEYDIYLDTGCKRQSQLGSFTPRVVQESLADLFPHAVVLDETTLLIECWANGNANPSHQLYGFAQVYRGLKILLEEGEQVVGRSFPKWILLLRCNMHHERPFTSFLRESIIRAIAQMVPLAHRPIIVEAPYFFGLTNSSAHFLLQSALLLPIYAESLVPESGMLFRDTFRAQALADPYQHLRDGWASPCTNFSVGVFQRSSGSHLRRFTNLAKVVEHLSTRYGYQVPVVTTNASMTVPQQLSALDSFDMLVGPHGSHIIMMLPSRVSVYVEVGELVYDKFCQRLFPVLGKSCLISYGHTHNRRRCPTSFPPHFGTEQSMQQPHEEHMAGPPYCRRAIKYVNRDFYANLLILDNALRKAEERYQKMHSCTLVINQS
jgi:hypothetical protein